MSGSKDPGAALSGLEPRAAGQLQGSGGGDRETEVREWKEGPEGRGIFGWAGAGAGPAGLEWQRSCGRHRVPPAGSRITGEERTRRGRQG